MYKDNIICDVWANRESYIDHFHHDIKEIINDLRARQKSSSRKLVDRRETPNKSMHLDSKKLG
jgi:hypothetical protein